MEYEDGKWIEYRMMVLDKLERLDREVKELDEKIAKNNHAINEKLDTLKSDILTLKTKSIVWGSIASAIVAPIAVSIILHFATLP